MPAMWAELSAVSAGSLCPNCGGSGMHAYLINGQEQREACGVCRFGHPGCQIQTLRKGVWAAPYWGQDMTTEECAIARAALESGGIVGGQCRVYDRAEGRVVAEFTARRLGPLDVREDQP